jgi:hypothetical protein
VYDRKRLYSTDSAYRSLVVIDLRHMQTHVGTKRWEFVFRETPNFTSFYNVNSRGGLLPLPLALYKTTLALQKYTHLEDG